MLGFGVAKGTAAYATAKAGVVQMTKALGVELAFKGVRVNAIAPGWFVTEINDDYLMSEAGDAIKRDIPMGRFGKDGDLDGALLLLASDAGSYITGATIVVDGGQVVHDQRVRKRSWTSRCLPRSKTSACACAPSSTSTCCRSKPIRRISPSTRTSRDERLAPVRDKAKKAGLWAPQSPKEYGGMELPIVAWAAIYEEAARSLFGPLAINCMAPDDGNMNLLTLVGTQAQKDKWLKPDRRRQGALVLRHDRAGARRRLRSDHDPHHAPRRRATTTSSPAANGSSPAPTAPRISS